MSIITLKEYLTASGKYLDRENSSELTPDKLENASLLLKRVNALLAEAGILSVSVSSGFRPQAANTAAGGAKMSLHMQCKAIDIADPDGELDALIESRNDLKQKYGLWQESPSKTTGWVHLDLKDRGIRKQNTFLP